MRWRLAAAVAGPTVLAILLAGNSVAAQVSAATDYARIDTLTALDSKVTTLVQALQQERDLTSGYIAAERAPNPARDQAQKDVDAAIRDYQQAAESITADADAALHDNLTAVNDDLTSIGFARQATQAASLTRASVLALYSQTITKLLSLATGIVDSHADRKLVDDERAVADFLSAKEFTSQLRAELAAIATTGTMALGDAQDLLSLRVDQQHALDSFQADANDAQRTAFADLVEGLSVTQVSVMLDSALAEQNSPRLDVNPATWYQTASTVLGLMHQVETRLLDQESHDITALQSQATTQAALAAAELLAAIVLAGAASALGARSITRPVQQLRSAALDVAHRQLPQVAAELIRTNGASVIDLAMPFLGEDSTDEFGELRSAFQASWDRFMALANEISAVHRRANEVVTNLAKRSQSLVHGMLLSLDEMERDELDPDQLAKLFKLDQPVTRLRRLHNTQLVLSGSRPAGRSLALPLVEVLGAAISEVDQYTRIHRQDIPPVALKGPVVNEVVHLLAELLDNATHYSQPDTWVIVSGDPSAGSYDDGVRLAIYDQGMGMSPSTLERANELLRNPDMIIESGSHAMGHQAVSRLAAYHHITVTLHRGQQKGVVAVVHLPAKLLTDLPALTTPAQPSNGNVSVSGPPTPFPPLPPQTQPHAAVAGPAMVEVPDARYVASTRPTTPGVAPDTIEEPTRHPSRLPRRDLVLRCAPQADGTFSLAELVRLRQRLDSITVDDSRQQAVIEEIDTDTHPRLR